MIRKILQENLEAGLKNLLLRTGFARNQRDDGTVQYRRPLPFVPGVLIFAQLPPGGVVKPHNHHEREFFVFGGSAVWTKNGREHIRRFGSLAYTRRNQPHAIRPVDRFVPFRLLVLKLP